MSIIRLTFLSIISVASTATAAIQYHVTDIGVVSGQTGSTAAAINDSGQITGTSGGHAFFYSNGTLTDLGQDSSRTTFGLAINSGGTVAGYSFNALATRSFLHAAPPASFVEPITSHNSYGYGLNDSGLLVGQTAFSGYTASKYDGTTLTNLGTLSGDSTSSALAVNNNGQIVGYSSGSPNGFFAQRAFTIAPNSTTMVDIGALGANEVNTTANAVNLSGQIAGASTSPTNGNIYHAFLWTSGSTGGTTANPQMKDLGVLSGEDSSYAYGINDAGVVVGTSDTISGTNYRAFVLSNGSIVDLNTLLDTSGTGWVLTKAFDINNSGMIVGEGTINGQTRAFVLSVVPEPSAGLLLLIFPLARRHRKVTVST